MKKYFEILFEDDDIVLVNKAACVLSIPDRYKEFLPNLKSLLHRNREEIFVVHRLDRDTSGIVCFAKNAKAHEHLSRQFEKRTIKKLYHAIVHGSPFETEGEINLNILIPEHKNKVIISTTGKPCQSKFKLLEKFISYAHLEVELITGRKHQIRAHLAHMKMPIVADETYGTESNWSLSKIKGKKYQLKKYEEEKPLIYRQLLHASSMTFTHPVTSKEMTIEAPHPKDFRAMLNQLRKLNSIQN